jgi:hypothetical protein
VPQPAHPLFDFSGRGQRVGRATWVQIMYGNDDLTEISVVWHHAGQKFISHARSLSLSGAFIESAQPPPLGTTLKLLFRVSGQVARVRAVVCLSVHNEGIGVEFLAMEQEDRACLAVAVEFAHELDLVSELVAVTDKGRSQPKFGYAINTIQAPEAERSMTDHARSAVERRIRPRHKISAQVQVADIASGKPISARLGNLSAGGCFPELETDSSFSLGTPVRLTITRGSASFQSDAKVVYAVPPKGVGVTFTGTESQHLRILGAWIMETSWLAAERRKNQRVFLSVPVRFSGHSALGNWFTEETQTVKVSADGCLLPLSTPVNKSQCVTLLNTQTKAMVECVIVRIEQSSNALREIGMSFLLPNRKFWQLNFPRVDRLAY